MPIRCQALATDYDGTLTDEGESVAPVVVDGLRRLRASGRRLVLVTGRVIDDLLRIFPEVGIFDLVVAENGAVIYRPATGAVETLAPPPDSRLVARLQQEGVAPLSVGHVVVATFVRHEAVVARVIRDLALDAQIVHNKGSVMVLPRGVDKATGLRHAMRELGISAKDAVAVGDAENDECLLAECGCGVAVANALPALRARAQVVTAGPGGRGVLEIIETVLATG